MFYNLTRTLRANIINPNIAHTNKQLRMDPKLSFYPVVGLVETKLGALYLNKPDNNNNITEQCCDQLFRFFNSYHHDHTVENVFLENKGKVFSGGADYQQLLTNQLYLDKLYRMAIMLSNFNKPIFAKINGSVRGIASYLINMMSTPMSTQFSSMRLDQTARGFIPIIGGSYYLANLPCNIGIYISLTGKKLDRDQMIRLGIVKANLPPQVDSKLFKKKMSDANLFFSIPMPSENGHISEQRKDSLIRTYKSKFEDMIQISQRQIFSSKRNFYTKFALNQYRIAKTEYENIKNPFTSFSQNYQREINNYFQMRQDKPFNYLKNQNLIQEARPSEAFLSGLPLQKLIKIFSKNTIKQVLDQLQKDKSQWARQTEKQIRKKDPLAVNLTFELIKRAQNLSWVQCLELEYTIAKRLLKQSKIGYQINEYSSRKILVNPFSENKVDQINQQKLNEYFKNVEQPSQKLEHEVPNYSLLPTSHYFRQFPDSVRNYLNRTFFEDVHAKNSSQQVKRFLQLNKIDYRDQSYNVDVLRQRVYALKRYEQRVQLQKARLRSIFIKNSQTFTKYKNERQKFIEQKMSNRVQAIAVIGTKLKNQFNKHFQQKFNDLQKKTASIAGKQTKMDIFRNYQKTLLDNIVMNGYNFEQDLNKTLPVYQGIFRFDGNAKQGGTIFTASETKHQKNNEFLQDLKKGYTNNQIGIINQQFIQKYKHQQKPDNLLFETEISDLEAVQRQKHELVKKKYNRQIFVRNEVAKYKILMDKASETSQEIASLLGWEDEDIEAVITNAPRSKETYLDFAKDLKKNYDMLQKQLQKFNEIYSSIVSDKDDSLLKAESLTQTSPFEEIHAKHYFFDLKRIPRPFRNIYMKIFEEVLSYFLVKYQNQGKIIPDYKLKQTKNIMDQWVQKSISKEITEFLKNDVEYVFSYIGLIYLRDIIEQIKNHQENSPLDLFISDSGFDFDGYKVQQIETSFSNFLYSLTDIHADAKQRILFPQTKIIDFMNRVKINSEINYDEGISFETIMLLVAKDRKRIRDRKNDKKPLLGYQPEYSLSILREESKKYVNKKRLSQIMKDSQGQFSSSNPLKQSFITQQELQQNFISSNRQQQQQINQNIVIQGQNDKDDDNPSQQFQDNIQQEVQSENKLSTNFQIPINLKSFNKMLQQQLDQKSQEKITNHLGLLSLQRQRNSASKKRLILGFQSYVMRLQAIIQQIAGQDMFLSDQLRQNINKQSFQQLRQILRTDLDNQQWLDLQLNKLIYNLLEFRYEKEKDMTQAQLQVFDEQFFQIFSPQVIKTLLINQMQVEQELARSLIKQPKQNFIQQEDPQKRREFMYYELKDQIKNPKALQMLNNLFMSENVVRERLQQIEFLNQRKTKYAEDITPQQRLQLQDQVQVQLPSVTYNRLTSDIFNYKDDQLDPHRVRDDMEIALGKSYQPTTKFLDEIKEIKNFISQNDLKSDIQLRIKRLQMIE